MDHLPDWFWALVVNVASGLIVALIIWALTAL